MKQKKLVMMLVFLMLASAAVLCAAPDVWVDLRLYEGAREKAKEQSSVVTSYHLKAISSAGKILDVDISGEKAELEKVFNLQGVKLMTQAKWGWDRNLTDKQFQLVVLNGHKFLIQLTLMEKADHFKLEVVEKSGEKNRKDLETTLVIPQGKTTVFGFEDSLGKPYFISCQRHPDTKSDLKEPVKVPFVKRPQLIKKIKPKYPKEALRARVSGTVTVNLITDIYGRVADILRISGHPMLQDASIEAVKQWVYEPFILQGIPRRATFTVVISFNLNKDKSEGTVDIEQVKPVEAGRPKLIKKVEPKYPEEALTLHVEDIITLEAVTDTEGSVKDIVKVSGHPLLTKAAVEAVRQWQYEPFIKDGKPREVKFTVFVRFNLDKEKKGGVEVLGENVRRVPATEKPKLIRKVNPKYPREALKAKVQGKVILEASTDIYGRVFEVSAISGHPLLARAAVKAVQQWVYEPFIKEGKPHCVKFTVVVDFNLGKNKKGVKK